MVLISEVAVMPFEKIVSLPESELPDLLNYTEIKELHEADNPEDIDFFMDHLFAYNELPSLKERIVGKLADFKTHATERVESGNGGTVVRWTKWYFGVVGPLNLMAITTIALAGGPAMIEPVTSEMVAEAASTLSDKLIRLL
jgi:hypothetical protein